MEYTFENVFVDRKGFSLIYLVNIAWEIETCWLISRVNYNSNSFIKLESKGIIGLTRYFSIFMWTVAILT